MFTSSGSLIDTSTSDSRAMWAFMMANRSEADGMSNLTSMSSQPPRRNDLSTSASLLVVAITRTLSPEHLSSSARKL